MILLGFAWFLFTLDAANSPLVYTFALVTGGLWGAVFLHLGLSFPTGRLRSRLDRVLVIAGYVVFPLAFAPALLFADPEQLGCSDCPENLLLIRSDDALAAFFTAFGALLYIVLFIVVLARAIRLWRRTGAVRAAAADAGLRLLAADLPARHGGEGGRGRRRLLGRVHRHRPDAARVPRRAAAQPRLAPRR